MLGVKPSYRTGYARWLGESEYPQLWKGLGGAWAPFLGATGNKVQDLSGNGNTGTLTGTAPSWTAGKYGSAVLFPGTDEYIAFGDPDQLSLNRNFTLGVGFRTNDITDYQTIYGHGDGEIGFRQNNAGKLEFLESQVALVLTADTALTVGKTHNVALTMGSGATATVTIYLDGQQDGQTTTNRTYNNGVRQATLAIADDSTGFFFPLDGNIEYFYVYHRTLSASEIALHQQIMRRYTS